MILMHKDIPVADITFSADRRIASVRVRDRGHMPVGTYSEYPQLIAAKLQRWMEARAIPSERQGRGRIEEALGCRASDAVLKSMAVSLTDCYWIKDERMPALAWKDVNYHENGFSQEIASVVLYGSGAPIVDFRSPDLTTGGALKKAWVMAGGVPSLVKFGDFGGNAGGKNLLSANEVAAYRVAEKMGLSHAEYVTAQITGTGEKVCMTPCFIRNPNEEFITASQIVGEHRMDGKTLYRFFADIGMKQDMDSMIVFDHIIHNTDRHEKNFGVIADPDTMEFQKFVPLFDSGSSFGWNYSPDTVDMGDTKPFGRNRMEQLGMACLDGIYVPEEKDVIGILQDTYEEFGLLEQNFRIAEEDVRKSYGMLQELERERMPEEEWER